MQTFATLGLIKTPSESTVKSKYWGMHDPQLIPDTSRADQEKSQDVPTAHMWCCILFDCPWEPAKTLLSGWGAFLALALFPLSLPCHKICGSLFLVSPSHFLAKLSNNSHSQIYTHANSFFEWQAKKKITDKIKPLKHHGSGMPSLHQTYSRHLGQPFFLYHSNPVIYCQVGSRTNEDKTEESKIPNCAFCLLLCRWEGAFK